MERHLFERDRHDGDLVACILEPQTLTAGVTTTATVNMQGFDRCLFEVLGGAANASPTTLDIVVHQCTQAADAGADAKVLAGNYGTKAITQVTAGAGFATLNDLWLLEVKTEEMDVDGGFEFLLLSITVSAADTWVLGVKAMRAIASYEPVAVTNVTEVVPIPATL